jgi:hypothetical protein
MPAFDYDIQVSFEGGQDVSLPSTRLEPNKFVAGINVSTSKGVIRPRYGLCRKKLTMQRGGYSYAFNKLANFSDIFYGGLFQAYVPYRIGSRYYQLVVINGTIFMIDQSDFSVRVLTLNLDTQLNQYAKRINAFVAAKYVVFADFPNRPVIIENGVARRSSAALNELPVLNLGTYNQNRALFSNTSNEWTGGDPAGSLTAPLAPITIDEISAGGPFVGEIYKVPSNYDDPITALTTLQAVDTSTGIGVFIAATQEQIYSFDTTKPRSDWKDIGQFGTCLSYEAGIVDQRAQVNVNSDLFFISKDGALRGLSAARDEQRKWARTPMSLPVENWVQYYDKELIQFTRLCYFNNKIFWTVRPTRSVASRLDGSDILDVYHSGLVVLDMSNVSRGQGLSSEFPPGWDGLWTGVKPMDMIVNDNRMFIISKDSSTNQIYEVTPDSSIDRTDEGYRRPIKSVIYSRDYFVKNLFQDKQLTRLESNVTDISGKFKLDVKYKPSDAPNFIPWGNYQLDALLGYEQWCDQDVRQRTSVALKELNLPRPDIRDSSNPVNQDLYETIRRVQFRIELEGDSWQLNEYAVFGSLEDPELNKGATQEQPTEVEAFKELTGDWEYKEFGL